MPTARQANFWRTLTANRTITLDGSKTVGTMLFDSPFSYTISPGTGGSLVLNNSGSPATITSNQGSHNINVNVQLTGSLTATVSTNTLTIGGVVSGSGNFTKGGAGTLVLSAINSYTGNTTVAAGKLTLNNRFLADAADVYVSTGATLDLKFSGIADIIDSLFLNGVSQAVGIWGASGSGAQFTTPLLTGTGWLQVSAFIPPPLVGDYNQDGVVSGADYALWRNSIGATGIANRDPSNTGLVGQADYVSWRAQYGKSVLGAGDGMSDNAAIPEPASVALACGAFIVSLASRRRSRRQRL